MNQTLRAVKGCMAAEYFSLGERSALARQFRRSEDLIKQLPIFAGIGFDENRAG